MRKCLILAAALLPTAAMADGPAPELQAVAQMVQECQGREVNALASVYKLQAQLVAEKKRADDAEAKLKAAAPADK